MDFVIGLPRSHRRSNSIWVIVDRLTKSAHFLLVKTTFSADEYAKLYVKEIVRLHRVLVSIISNRGAQFIPELLEIIPKRTGEGENDSKSVIDRSKQAKVLLRYPTMRLGVCHERMGIPKGVANEKPDEKVSQVASKLELPPELEAVHPVFRTSMLRKCLSDPSYITPIEDIQAMEDLSYKEVLVAILDRQARNLQIKESASVKVLWRNKNEE
ncbi:PREDICTED: uncharacterized protein LOC109237137 [Nicotiana attenuata]|uniref:uncharacterized protein LOC109237137 n=1 Tax=Nicotiana attenuata TaxID=49451 RepID=UPI0009048E5C|nr:PREDICTED: uncharacterized protein LOC109237137 [Nicotiana attenuata]